MKTADGSRKPTGEMQQRAFVKEYSPSPRPSPPGEEARICSDTVHDPSPHTSTLCARSIASCIARRLDALPLLGERAGLRADPTQFHKIIRSLGLTIILILLALSTFIARADDSQFLTRTYTNAAGSTLPYRLLPPKNYDPAKSYPIILYLHGAAARGTDNTEPLNWGPRLFLEERERGRHEFFLVVPQCPRNQGWASASALGLGAARENNSLKLALELVTNALPREFNIDPRRRYLTGVSMGGHGVWVALNRQPGVFAAAVPVCAPADAGGVSRASARTPVWVFHSDDDHLVPVQEARNMVKAWTKNGGQPKYSEYTGLKHSSWKKAYVEAEMFDWLFGHRLP